AAVHVEGDTADGVHVPAVGGERDIELADVDGGCISGVHHSTSPMNSRDAGCSAATASAGVRPAALRRRARRRGSARSLRLSPMSVIPRIAMTMARPGGMDVHQMPAATSLIDLLRS